MGDFAMIDMYLGFDIIKNADAESDEDKYRHSETIMQYTWLVWVLSVFFLFMVFMNFIIAVISNSFSKVLEYKIAYDYLQRAIMIHELEVHFSDKSLENPEYFPDILIIRKRKQGSVLKNNWQSYSLQIKNFVKQQM